MVSVVSCAIQAQVRVVSVTSTVVTIVVVDAVISATVTIVIMQFTGMRVVVIYVPGVSARAPATAANVGQSVGVVSPCGATVL